MNNSVLPSKMSPEEQVERAVAFFVAARQSRAGQFRDFATVTRNRTRRKMNEQTSAWLTAVDGLPAVHARLKRILILNQPALDVIKSQDGPSTLFYLAPPIFAETRISPEIYAHEMPIEDHAQLLEILSTIKGKFMLGGYPNDLYLAAEKKHGWKRHEQKVPNNAAGGLKKRLMVECVWTNY
jgi:DNA adenine methylase